ncbi:MAG: glutamate synthase [Ruminococcus sp.]|jgi:glutamate synthase domain-containing protein 3|nr:glutamate synthase [Ruminococcus sp.]
MITIDAKNKYYKELNREIADAPDNTITVENVCGQRYIGTNSPGKDITVIGTPGNGLGAYLNGVNLVIRGNAQDATGDTMDSGEIIIHGCVGDACGYGMRDGKIYVKDDAGYRAGIHMKEYNEKVPNIIIGGKTGSFLGEYQAGGRIIVLGIGYEDRCPVGGFCGTGMHGGEIFIRTEKLPVNLPAQVEITTATASDMESITPGISEFCERFDIKAADILSSHFYKLTPNSSNPYTELYVNQ